MIVASLGRRHELFLGLRPKWFKQKPISPIFCCQFLSSEQNTVALPLKSRPLRLFSLVGMIEQKVQSPRFNTLTAVARVLDLAVENPPARLRSDKAE